jgi:hypothetical protein
MNQPVWATPAGSLGTFPSGTNLSIRLIASPAAPASTVTFKLLSGSLPSGTNMIVTADGLISGVVNQVSTNTEFIFTIRCTDDIGNIRDRTFLITVAAALAPRFLTPSGRLMETFDSKWIEFQLLFNNPVSTNKITIDQTLGELPLGLEISESGLIRGYPNPPLSSGIPINKTYTFTVTLSSALGSDSRTFSILVKNWSLANASNSRVPAILNTNPASFELNPYDPLYSYYVLDNTMPVFNSGDYFSFKIIGKDFDGGTLYYDFKNLPLGLSGNTTTGWVTGIPSLGTKSISEFRFSVRVQKANKKAVSSPYQEFKFVISNDIKNDLVWVTQPNLGTVSNGQISDLYVKATSNIRLEYRLVSGKLPPNMVLKETGDIVGRIPQQPTDELLELGESNSWSFTIEAFSPQFPLLVISRTFTLTVRIDFPEAYENLYFRANLGINDRNVLNTLLKNDDLIPPEYIYRSNDPYFGKASTISYVHAFGMKSSSVEQYIEAVKKNHYWRKVVLGELQTAVAKDAAGNVIYEVVYSPVIDDLVNSKKESIPSEIVWPRYIPLKEGPWLVSSTKIFTSYENVQSINYNTSLSPGEIRKLYPASFKNMREEVASNIGENYDSDLLPRWMTTQQSNGVILGYIQAWVICYTKPGFSQKVKENILFKWNYRVNRFDFTVDRYMVDKTATFDFNTYLNPPRWNQTPSATPEPDPINKNDYMVLFPQKTIIPPTGDR